MTDSNDLPSVSMANTKKELLEAYQSAKKRFDRLSKDLLDAEKTRKRMEQQLATATADAQAAQDPVKRLLELRGAIGHELTNLAERFETEIDTYRNIQSAIETKQVELDTIYEVETTASDLAALIDAQRTKKEQYEQEMSAQRATFEGEIQEMRANWQKEKAAHDREVKEQAEAIKKQRQRDQEEYEYVFAREKEKRTNSLADELQALEKEIAVKRSDFERDMEQRIAALDAREEAINNKENALAMLQKEVDAFEKRLESAVQTAVSETDERLTRDFKNEKTLLQTRFEGEKNVLLGKIESLEKTVASQAAQINDLSKKNELAYEKVQDIANRAVTASRQDRYTPSVHHSGVAVHDDKPS
ncbi:MAG: hypothetical protein PVG51_09850 [Desulfosarcina sp.]|jgi:hypothetical protein